MRRFAQILTHWRQWFARASPVKIRRNHPDFRGDTASAVLVDLQRRFLVHLRIVKAEHRHRGAKHIHRICVSRRGLDEIEDAAGKFALRMQLFRALFQLHPGRQFVVPKKINDFLVAHLSGELVDIVTGVNQLALIADDIAQARGVRDDAFKSARSARHDYDSPFIRAISVSAMTAGVGAIAVPAALSASIFPAAVPFPPDTIAPACPIRRPGGAVRPAMKAVTGFSQLSRVQSAASSSAEPPISPIKIIAVVPESSLKSFTASR